MRGCKDNTVGKVLSLHIAYPSSVTSSLYGPESTMRSDPLVQSQVWPKTKTKCLDESIINKKFGEHMNFTKNLNNSNSDYQNLWYNYLLFLSRC